MEDVVAADKLAGEIAKQYQDGLSYKRRMGFLDKWPEMERMKAGDQWPAPTQRTRSMPRPVFNVIKMIEGHKVANVMSEQIKLMYTNQEMDSEAESDTGDLFSRYADATWERLKQDELNEEALDIAANTGTVAIHYYFDVNKKGGREFPWIGELEGEVLDPVNIFFGNPQQRKVQEQPYILISSREDVKSIRDQARANGMSKEMVTQIKPDKDTQDEVYDGAKTEVNDTGKVTVITRYWKGKDENIYFCKVSSGLTIKKATSTNLSLYPVAVMQWERRKKSIFGIGETEGLIPNQKAINLLMAMQILSAQLTGWPKLIYKAGAIDPSKVTNAPGEMIEDRSAPGVGDGVKYLNPVNMSAAAANLVEQILTITRQVTGANDAATGTAPSADLNATAIMLLQKAAGIPIESIKRRFYNLVEDIGRIWEDFWKVKYNIARQVTLKDDENEEYPEYFKGTDHQGTELNLKIDVGPSSTYSESLMLSSLDKFLERGDITFEQYLKFAPKNVVPYRDRLTKELEESKGIVGQIEQFVKGMQPEEKAMFDQMPPEQQLQLIQSVVAPQQQLTQEMQQPVPIGM
jgi:hypothetical protein